MRIMRRLTIFLVGLALSILGLSVMEWPINYSVNAANITHASTAWYSSPGFDIIFGTVALILGLAILVLGFRGILMTGKLH